jgi:hypothetical protein
MKRNKFCCFLTAFFLIFYATSLIAGFLGGTLVETPNGSIPIEQLQNNDHVQCYNVYKVIVDQPIVCVTKKHVNRYKRIIIDDESINTTLNQLFYSPLTHTWTEAHKLHPGDVLLNDLNEHKIITHIQNIEKEADIHDITVTSCHNFYVSKNRILVHNFTPLITIGATWIIGGGIQFSLGIAGFIIGGLIATCKTKKKKPEESIFLVAERDGEKEPKTTNQNQPEKKESIEPQGEAQAPGKPTADDGFIPPKNWDGKKVKNPYGSGSEWPDENGNIWIPTGPKGHGGPHWDVQVSKKRHNNVLPGGKIRGEK